MEKDVDSGFVASVPELPGCYTQGETLAEVRVNVREAIELYLEDADTSTLPEFVSIEMIEVEG
ncbi:MAG: type II toxin-antitoxin system HicB family antitoxin [Thermoplasmatota archaeon]